MSKKPYAERNGRVNGGQFYVWLLAILALLAIAPPAQAGTYAEGTVSLTFFGFSIEADWRQWVDVNRMRVEWEIADTTQAFFGGNEGAQATIYHSDREMIWDLKLRDRTYTEKTYQDVHEESVQDELEDFPDADRMRAMVDSIQAEGPQPNWTFRVIEGAASEILAGMATSQSIFSATGENIRFFGDQGQEMAVALEVWVPDTSSIGRELYRQYETLCQQLGYDEEWREMKAEQNPSWGETLVWFTERCIELETVPLRASVGWGLGGGKNQVMFIPDPGQPAAPESGGIQLMRLLDIRTTTVERRHIDEEMFLPPDDFERAERPAPPKYD